MAVWYVRDNAPTSTIGWSAVTAWAANTAIAAGVLRRQLATPTVGNERVFVSIVGGTTHATTEPIWVVTKGAKNTDNTVTWQECTGQPAVNGDLTDTALSSTVRSIAQSLGKIIKDNAGTHIFICSTAGTPGAGEPTYVTAAVGNTTTDGTATWTYIGASFSAWAAPHARTQNALVSTWAAAGDDVYQGDDHSQTQSTAINQGSQGTSISPVNVWCIDHTASLPPGGSAFKSDPYTTSSPACAQITTTGNNNITFSGITNFHGTVFNCGSGAVAASISFNSLEGRFEKCSFRKFGTVASSTAITMPEGEFIDCSMQFGSTSDRISTGTEARLRWRNSLGSAIIGATIPTVFCTLTGGAILTFEGVDLSAITSGKTIISPGATSDATVLLLDCKYASGVTVATSPTASRSTRVFVVSSDSSGAIYRQEIYDIAGTLTAETTIVRSGGATDGVTPLAWKGATTANSKWLLPFECFPIDIWNDVVGSSRTVTMFGIWGGGSPPNNDEIFFDVQYFGDSGSPLASVATSTKANYLTAAAALASDGSVWGGSTTAFKMTATFTPQLAGYLRITVKMAKISSTFYVDPTPVLS